MLSTISALLFFLGCIYSISQTVQTHEKYTIISRFPSVFGFLSQTDSKTKRTSVLNWIFESLWFLTALVFRGIYFLYFCLKIFPMVSYLGGFTNISVQITIRSKDKNVSQNFVLILGYEVLLNLFYFTDCHLPFQQLYKLHYSSFIEFMRHIRNLKGP